MKNVLLPIIGVILFITAIGLFQNRFEGSFYNPIQQETPTPTPEKKEISIAGNTLMVDVAQTDEQRKRGLSGRDSLEEGTGMLFVFDENSRPTFWMKDVSFAIDIIWVDDGKIVGIDKDVQPEKAVAEEELALYPAPQPIDYAIEVNAGYNDGHLLNEGDTVNLSFITN